MRVFLSGPSVGPLHTVLWSSRSRRRHVRGAGWLYLLIALAGALTWAWIAAPWIGILATIGAAVITALAVYGMLAARKETRARADAPAAAWKAEHVPASAEYKAAHQDA